MTRENALKSVQSGSTHDRLKAARFLARNAQPGDLPLLRQARQVETVSYVKTSLDLGIARLSNLPAAPTPDLGDEYDVPEVLRRHLRRQAVEWIAGLLMHEISSPIGLIKRAASREILEYGTSRTKRHLDNVGRIFEAVEQLMCAAAAPKPEPFDLSEMIADIIAIEIDFVGPAEVSLLGPRPLMVTSDPALLRLVISNGVRNAIEAVKLGAPEQAHPIVVTWDQTDVDYWVSVLDRGPGIIGPTESAFEIGKSTKQGHSGFGLAIARQAIETLGGTVALEPTAQGGARYEARWER